MSATQKPAAAWSTRLLVAGIGLSIVLIAWLGYLAVEGWRQSAMLLARQRAEDSAERLATVLSRDMRGVQASVLASAQWDQFMLDPPFDVRTTAASAFARYPYPESFFACRGLADSTAVVFLNRADRRPPWMAGDTGTTKFPVIVEYAPTVAGRLLNHIAQDAALGRRYSAFETTIGGERYQVVARLLYRDALRERLEGVFGFTVSLPWVRAHYFPEITKQVARIGDSSAAIPLAVSDAGGTQVAGDPAAMLHAPIARRSFPLAFFDPLTMPLDLPDLPRESWVASAAAGGDRALADAVEGGNRTLAVAGVATVVFVLGLALTARASRTRAQLAELRSTFVSTVTHELKTPIAAIRAAGDTMARGRITGADAWRDYSQLVAQEARRLGRLVDNLLAYSRITDVTDTYTFAPLDVTALVDDVLTGFRTLLRDGGFEVAVDVPPDIPPVRADRTACVLLFDNLVDNAVRYSPAEKWIGLSARAAGRTVAITVTDRGMGIPADELARVPRRFFRGRSAGSGGSGLGLAIATRIAEDHGGSLRIESTVGEGTAVTVTLPAADEQHEEAHPRR